MDRTDAPPVPRLAGQEAGSPGPGQVESAARALDVEDLAGKKQSLPDPGFESPGIDLAGVDAARSELGLVPAARPLDRETLFLEG